MDKFSVREKYYEKPTSFSCGLALATIKTWVFYYPDGTKESLTMKVIKNVDHISR